MPYWLKGYGDLGYVLRGVAQAFHDKPDEVETNEKYGKSLAMAVGNVVWDIVSDEAFLANVRRVSGVLQQGLKSLADSHPDKVESVTGKGLLTGIKLKADPKNLQGLCRDSNLLVGVAGANVLRLAPPLVIEDAHVREAVGVMDAALTEWVPG